MIHVKSVLEDHLEILELHSRTIPPVHNLNLMVLIYIYLQGSVTSKELQDRFNLTQTTTCRTTRTLRGRKRPRNKKSKQKKALIAARRDPHKPVRHLYVVNELGEQVLTKLAISLAHHQARAS